MPRNACHACTTAVEIAETGGLTRASRALAAGFAAGYVLGELEKRYPNVPLGEREKVVDVAADMADAFDRFRAGESSASEFVRAGQRLLPGASRARIYGLVEYTDPDTHVDQHRTIIVDEPPGVDAETVIDDIERTFKDVDREHKAGTPPAIVTIAEFVITLIYGTLI